MFFLISKLFWFVCAPSHLIGWLVITAAVLLFLHRERAARWLCIGSAGLFILFALLPTGVWLMQALENMYPRPPYPARVDGILVLGGGQDPVILQSRGVIGNDRALPRLVGAFELAHKYPNARVIFSGGSGLLGPMKSSESVVARHVMLEMGLEPSRLVLENKSRNTWQNLLFTKQLVNPKPGETWVLATSAFHMPRAIAIAKKVGWEMVPWPTDYWTSRDTHYRVQDIPENLERTDSAVHEFIGVWTYRLSGKAA